MSSLDRRRIELERGTGGDHDVPYTFALPHSLPLILAWMKLLAKVHVNAMVALAPRLSRKKVEVEQACYVFKRMGARS